MAVEQTQWLIMYVYLTHEGGKETLGPPTVDTHEPVANFTTATTTMLTVRQKHPGIKVTEMDSSAQKLTYVISYDSGTCLPLRENSTIFL